MAKNVFKDLLNKQLSEENQRLLNDLQLCQKRVEFLENYRKVLNQFNRNCICDQNKITTYLFRSLERQYKQIPHKQYKRQLKTKKSAKTDFKLITENIRPKPVIDRKYSKRRKLIDENTATDHRVGCSYATLPKTYIEATTEETESEGQEIEIQITLPQIDIQTVDITCSPSTVNVSEPMQSSAPQMTPEIDCDLTFPSFNDPIFSLNANFVEELAAQVVPKIDEQIIEPTINDKCETEVTKSVPKPQHRTVGEQNILSHKQIKNSVNFSQRSDNSDLIFGKSNLKFRTLLENLKNGRLQSFTDPSNDMISLILKDFLSIDGKKVSKIVYKCNHSLCGFETNSQQYIYRHILRHKKSKTFKSSLINFRTFNLLLEDLKSGKLESFIDPDYDSVLVTFKRSNSYENESQLIFKCLYPNCQFETYGKYSIRSHVLRHNKVFACSVCHQSFGSNVSRVEHQIRVHNNHKNPLFKCEFPECVYKTTVRQSMEFHKMKHKSEKTFKCETIGCDLYFKSVCQMKSHMKRVHILKTVECGWPGCEARFKTKYELQNHIMTHTGEKITVSKIRDILKEGNFISTVDKNNKLFSVIRQQKINESDGQMEIGPKLGYKCNSIDCKFICITPHLILEHTLSHSMGKAFECDLCHKTYTLRNHLNNHKKLVHNINNKCSLLECEFPECHYSTRNPYCFRQHERTHQTDTPFKCPEEGCKRSFKTSISLKHHLSNCHMDVDLLACSWPGCKSSFKSKSYLNYHLKCHSKPKQTYECQYCEKSFNFKANLTKHTKSQHSID